MRDYKLRKRVFNEYPTTAEVQNMIAQGGGGSGETRTPIFEFDLTGSETGDDISEYVDIIQLMSKAPIIEMDFNGARLTYDYHYDIEGGIGFAWTNIVENVSQDRVEVDIEINTTSETVTIYSASGHLIAYENTDTTIVLRGTFNGANNFVINALDEQLQYLTNMDLMSGGEVTPRAFYLAVFGSYDGASISCGDVFGYSVTDDNCTYRSPILINGNPVTFTINNKNEIVGTVSGSN